MSVVPIKYHSAILAKIEHEAETDPAIAAELEKELEKELDEGKEVKRVSESEAAEESKEGKEKICRKIQHVCFYTFLSCNSL